MWLQILLTSYYRRSGGGLAIKPWRRIENKEQLSRHEGRLRIRSNTKSMKKDWEQGATFETWREIENKALIGLRCALFWKIEACVQAPQDSSWPWRRPSLSLKKGHSYLNCRFFLSNCKFFHPTGKKQSQLWTLFLAHWIERINNRDNLKREEVIAVYLFNAIYLFRRWRWRNGGSE